MYIPTKNTFHKLERLKSAIAISNVFQEGVSEFAYPILATYQKGDFKDKTPYPAQVTFSVSKKKFKKAVDRNRIKRLMREAYRLEKNNFYQSLSLQNQYQIVFVYVGKQIEPTSKIQRSILKILDRICNNETI